MSKINIILFLIGLFFMVLGAITNLTMEKIEYKDICYLDASKNIKMLNTECIYTKPKNYFDIYLTLLGVIVIILTSTIIIFED